MAVLIFGITTVPAAAATSGEAEAILFPTDGTPTGACAGWAAGAATSAEATCTGTLKATSARDFT
ncbi:hypothetical protein D3C87_2103950 [compost metagenome]